MQRNRGILVVVTFALLGSVGLVRAGDVYGKITEQGASVGAGATVAAKCGETAYPAVKTDAAGSFYLKLKETGKCTLTIEFKGQSADLGIASYAEGVQVDLVLETKDGKLAARRK